MPELSRITAGNRRLSGIVRVLAADQQGVVRRAQLLESGVAESAIERALRSGSLHRLNRGVYSVIAP